MSDEATNPFLSKSVGQGSEKSGQKAKHATERTNLQAQTVDSEAWPRGTNGKPMMKILMTASELIPTGQFANVSVGPCQITAFVDPERQLGDGDSYFSEQERATLAQALNELAEIVEGDVVAVQRNMVLESMQQQIASNGK